MSVKNKITLIIPDLHHRWRQAEKIITAVGADEVLFLGDYFDDFNDDINMVRETSEWLVDSVKKPNRTHLYGNHDIQYGFAYSSFQCSGYTQWKYFIIHDMVPRETWDKLKYFHILDNTWLLSHGGLHNHCVPNDIKKLRIGTDKKYIVTIGEYLDKEIVKAFQNAANHKGSWVFNAGHARGGFQRVGGITWCDYDREFFPLMGINQIVGHTPQMQGPIWCVLDRDPLNSDGVVGRRPMTMYSPTLTRLNDPALSHNIDLDVFGNTHWAVWNGKKLTFGNYQSL